MQWLWWLLHNRLWLNFVKTVSTQPFLAPWVLFCHTVSRPGLVSPKSCTQLRVMCFARTYSNDVVFHGKSRSRKQRAKVRRVNRRNRVLKINTVRATRQPRDHTQRTMQAEETKSAVLRSFWVESRIPHNGDFSWSDIKLNTAEPELENQGKTQVPPELYKLFHAKVLLAEIWHPYFPSPSLCSAAFPSKTDSPLGCGNQRSWRHEADFRL